MSVLFILLAGLSIDIKSGDSCVEALHRLRSEGGVRLVATETLQRADGEVLVYTLTKGKNRTAILGCVLAEE